MQRQTLQGTLVSQLDTPKTYSLITKTPSKWVVVDIEHGSVFTPNDDTSQYQFKKASIDQLIEAKEALTILINELQNSKLEC